MPGTSPLMDKDVRPEGREAGDAGRAPVSVRRRLRRSGLRPDMQVGPRLLLPAAVAVLAMVVLLVGRAGLLASAERQRGAATGDTAVTLPPTVCVESLFGASLRVLVDSGGFVTGVELARSAGTARLDSAACAYARRLRFERPGAGRGRAPVWLTLGAE
jgi:TonB family protein